MYKNMFKQSKLFFSANLLYGDGLPGISHSN